MRLLKWWRGAEKCFCHIWNRYQGFHPPKIFRAVQPWSSPCKPTWRSHFANYNPIWKKSWHRLPCERQGLVSALWLRSRGERSSTTAKRRGAVWSFDLRRKNVRSWEMGDPETGAERICLRWRTWIERSADPGASNYFSVLKHVP